MGTKKHIRKICILLANILLNNRFVFSMVGLLNRRWNFIASVFVCYPASEEYANAYVYPRHRHIMTWTPWPVGFYRQDEKWGLKMVISATEHDFYKKENMINLKSLISKTESIRRVLGAQQKSFAGVLPGLMYSKRIIRHSVESDVTIEAVLRAIKKIKANYKFNKVPIIVLGGKGFLGRKLIERLNSHHVYCVDYNSNGGHSDHWPNQIKGRKTILINLSSKGAISDYINCMWKEIVLINEVYPEPSRAELDELTMKGIKTYHIVGIAGYAVPSFPKVYEGAIPCCAARITNKMDVVLKQLN